MIDSPESEEKMDQDELELPETDSDENQEEKNEEVNTIFNINKEIKHSLKNAFAAPQKGMLEAFGKVFSIIQNQSSEIDKLHKKTTNADKIEARLNELEANNKSLRDLIENIKNQENKDQAEEISAMVEKNRILEERLNTIFSTIEEIKNDYHDSSKTMRDMKNRIDTFERKVNSLVNAMNKDENNGTTIEIPAPAPAAFEQEDYDELDERLISLKKELGVLNSSFEDFKVWQKEIQSKIKALETESQKKSTVSTIASTVTSEVPNDNKLLTVFEEKISDNLEELQNIENRIKILETSIIASRDRKFGQSKAEENLVTSNSNMRPDSFSAAFLNNINSESRGSISLDVNEEKIENNNSSGGTDTEYLGGRVENIKSALNNCSHGLKQMDVRVTNLEQKIDTPQPSQANDPVPFDISTILDSELFFSKVKELVETFGYTKKIVETSGINTKKIVETSGSTDDMDLYTKDETIDLVDSKLENFFINVENRMMDSIQDNNTTILYPKIKSEIESSKDGLQSNLLNFLSKLKLIEKERVTSNEDESLENKWTRVPGPFDNEETLSSFIKMLFTEYFAKEQQNLKEKFANLEALHVGTLEKEEEIVTEVKNIKENLVILDDQIKHRCTRDDVLKICKSNLSDVMEKLRSYKCVLEQQVQILTENKVDKTQINHQIFSLQKDIAGQIKKEIDVIRNYIGSLEENKRNKFENYDYTFLRAEEDIRAMRNTIESMPTPPSKDEVMAETIRRDNTLKYELKEKISKMEDAMEVLQQKSKKLDEIPTDVQIRDMFSTLDHIIRTAVSNSDHTTGLVQSIRIDMKKKVTKEDVLNLLNARLSEFQKLLEPSPDGTMISTLRCLACNGPTPKLNDMLLGGVGENGAVLSLGKVNHDVLPPLPSTLSPEERKRQAQIILAAYPNGRGGALKPLQAVNNSVQQDGIVSSNNAVNSATENHPKMNNNSSQSKEMTRPSTAG